MFIVPISQIASIFPAEEAVSMQQPASAVQSAPFVGILKDAIQNIEQAQQVSSADSEKIALGQMDDLHTAQINSMKMGTAIDFTLGLTSRAITAYNEIIRMQV